APRLRSSILNPQSSIRVSALVPARDEERRIERTVRALLAQTYPNFEIIVVNDRSTDATGAILEAIDDPRLRVITGEEPPPGWLGKPWALHQASQHARGELLLFLDADIHYEPGAIAAAVARIQQSGVAMISLLPRIEMEGFWEHIAMPNLAMMVFCAMPLWLANRVRSPLLAAGGGPGNLVWRDDYDAAGGHEALQAAVVDDVALARLVRRSGRRTEMVLADDFVSVRMYHGLRETIEGFTKNTFTVFGRSYIATVLIVILSIVLHVLPYVFALFGNLRAIAAVVALTLSRVLLFAFLGYRIDNALFGHVPMVLLWDVIFLRSAWITGVRRQLHWRGRRYDASRTRFGAD
ncbi:MAG TPA: glycosyltransferase family 2 protein, partial [Thermoanaerobaculia bacterium]|nr:glycosyltransferase family 2 protein [Thermoanaerobaculia bacterium]